MPKVISRGGPVQGPYPYSLTTTHAHQTRPANTIGGGDPLSSEWGTHKTEMCSGSEAGSYLRLIDFVYHSTLGLRVIKKKNILDSHGQIPALVGFQAEVLPQSLIFIGFSETQYKRRISAAKNGYFLRHARVSLCRTRHRRGTRRGGRQTSLRGLGFGV